VISFSNQTGSDKWTFLHHDRSYIIAVVQFLKWLLTEMAPSDSVW